MSGTGSVSLSWHPVRIAVGALAILAAVSLALAQTAPPSRATLDRVRESARMRLGYRADARPFAYRDDSGNAAGYAVALCQQVADAVKAELGLAQMTVEWVPVTLETRFQAVQQGQVDLLCGSDTETLARRKDVAFSIPIFPGGIGALVRTDAPIRLREILSGQSLPSGPTWRASAGQLLQAQIFVVVTGTTARDWLAKKLNEFQLTAEVVPVDGYEAGIRQLIDRKANVFFGDRAILLDAAVRNPSAGDLTVLDRLFTNERLALALARGDEDFRLVVDRTLSRLYASGAIRDVYAKWFGAPDEPALTFFRLNTLPD